MSKNQSFLIYVENKPFCVVYGSEQDANDFCTGRSATYEPIVTVMVQYGLWHGDDK